MTIAHEQPARPLALEDRRDALSVWDLSMNDQRKAFARDLHKLKRDWALLYPKASRRQFILWFTQGEHQTRLYAGIPALGAGKPAKIRASQRRLQRPGTWSRVSGSGGSVCARIPLYQPRLTGVRP